MTFITPAGRMNEPVFMRNPKPGEEPDYEAFREGQEVFGNTMEGWVHGYIEHIYKIAPRCISGRLDDGRCLFISLARDIRTSEEHALLCLSQ